VKLTLIPSSTDGGGLGHHQYLSSCVVNDTVALDAGCLGFCGTPHGQARIRHVLLSHTHIDHLASLPIFLENAYEGKPDCVTVHGSAAVLDCLQRDLFNGRVWPDFIALSQGDKPFLKLARLDPGQTVDLDGLRVTAVELNHVVPTSGFLLSDAHGSVAFVSDTGPTDEVWQLVNARPDLKAVFVETTFPDNMQWLADVSKHLTPRTLAGEVAKLARPVRLIVVHIKARYQEQVIAELKALNLPNLEIGHGGVTYTF
jgi:ribonuclease BN (tRNA processing enzyme)